MRDIEKVVAMLDRRIVELEEERRDAHYPEHRDRKSAVIDELYALRRAAQQIEDLRGAVTDEQAHAMHNEDDQ